jgi:hypothetical protein
MILLRECRAFFFYLRSEPQLRMLVDAALLSIAKTLHHRILSRHNRGKIHAHPTRTHALFLPVARVVRHLRRSDHRLGRSASRIDARPAKIRFFDERNAPAPLSKRRVKRIPRLSRANDDGLVSHSVHHGL